MPTYRPTGRRTTALSGVIPMKRFFALSKDPYDGPLPASLTKPAITGTATVGQTLTSTNGTWTDNPTTYTRRWLRDGVAISGATATTYVLVTADKTHKISVEVTAKNAKGTGKAAVSAPTVTIP